MLKQGHRLGDPFCCAHARSNDVFFHRPSDVPALVSRIEVYSEAAHVHELFSNMFKFLHLSILLITNFKKFLAPSCLGLDKPGRFSASPFWERTVTHSVSQTDRQRAIMPLQI